MSVEINEYTSWHSYPDSNALGHKYLTELFFDAVTVEEKVDGSQFSFGVFGDLPSDMRFRSKGAQIFVTDDGHSSEKMFDKAVQSVIKRQYLLHEGWTYRAEYLPKPKAVTLTYDRVPRDLFDNTDAYLIGYDVEIADEVFLSPDEKREEFARIGLECVPCFMNEETITDIEAIKALLAETSILGGQLIEGVCIKNYHRCTPDKKILIGKYVSKTFKELHGRDWAKGNPKSGDIVQTIIEDIRTPARWAKGVQHLREAGKLTDSNQDIALLFQEIPADIKKELEGRIKDELFKWAWPKISRGAMAGMPEWYKELLAAGQPMPEGHEPKGPDYQPQGMNPYDHAEEGGQS